MAFKSLLPVRNRTPVEVQLEQMMAGKHEAAKLAPDIIRKIQEPAECPAALLPWLAWAWSLDEWKDSWSETVKRQLISDAVDIHRYKGTPYAIKKALQAIGYDNVIIREARVDYHNGNQLRDGSIDHGSFQTFPLFDVILNIGYEPDSAEQTEIRARIERYKNERSVLRNLIFMSIFHNGLIFRDGTHTYNGGVL